MTALALLTITLQALASDIPTHTAGADEAKLERGGLISSLWNRGTLRSLSAKIRNHSVTADEIKEYIAKGGDIDHLRNYDWTRSFFVGDNESPLLNHLILPPPATSTYPAQPRPPDRLQSIRLLLAAGADANLAVPHQGPETWGYLPPVLQATLMGDLEALQMMFEFNARHDVTDSRNGRTYGPALLLASSGPIADFLVAKGADPLALDPEGRTLLQLAFEHSDAINPLEQTRWMLQRGIDPRRHDNNEVSAVSLAHGRVSSWTEIVTADPTDTSQRQLATWREIAQLLEEKKKTEP